MQQAALRTDPSLRRRASLPRAAVRLALLCVLACSLVACGGGGGGGGGDGDPLIIDGLTGTVRLPGFDLGRVLEQEPNDLPTQPFCLAPVWANSQLEVSGTLGTDAVWFGRVDTMDHLVFRCVRDQTVSLELTYEAIDPTRPGASNDFQAEVIRRATGVSLATTAPGGQPHTLEWDASANEEYVVVVSVVGDGHGWWLARFVCSEPPLSPKFDPGVAPPLAATSAPSEQGPVVDRPTTNGIEPDQQCAHTHVLVRTRAGCDAAGLCERHGVRLGARTGGGSHRVLFDTPGSHDPEARAATLCAALAADPDVLWAEPDWVIRPFGEPGNAEFNRQWNMRAVGATSAWDVTTGHESITIGIVDSGIGAAPDVEGQFVPGYDFVSSPAIAGDGGGRDPDPTDPGDQFASDGTSSWHGTHIAALLAGKHEGAGVAGMVPRCRLMMLRALGIGGGFVSDAADAILYAAGQLTLPDGTRLSTPLRIVNLSIGLPQDSSELREACTRASNLGVLLVAAVGNGGGAVEFPARYDSTLAVAAVDGHLLTTQYSAFGSSVDIAAPGGGPGGDAGNDGWHDGILSASKDETLDAAPWSHSYLVGTSQAAPHVAGAAAMMLAIEPGMTLQDLRAVLRGTALDLGVPGEDIAYGAGLLQAHEAVKVAMNRAGNPRGDGPRLLLPRTSVHFEGLRSSVDVPLMNAGGGTVNLFFATALPDDGGDWLGAVIDPELTPSPPVNHSRVTITVDRSRVPATPGRYSGTVQLANSAGTLGFIRVVMYVQERTRIGQVLPVVAIDEDGIARRRATALPETGYRYWMRNLPASNYVLQSGEDLDLDGFFCEGADACGWHGGPTQGDAIPVPHVPGSPAVRGLGITLRPPP